MKPTLLLIFTLLISGSCKNEIEEKSQAEIVNSNEIAAPSPILTSNNKLGVLKGSYVGFPVHNEFTRLQFPGLLNFSIVNIDEKNKTISGYLITKGTKTILEGKYKFDEKSNVFVIQDRKPNSFKIQLRKDGTKLVFSGEGLPLTTIIGGHDPSELIKRTFKYDPTLQVDFKKLMSYLVLNPNGKKENLLNASIQKLDEADLKDKSRVELIFIKNAIYARHGMALHDVYFFENVVKWYAPYFLNVDDKLTDLEKTNIVLLEKFEKLAPKRTVGP